MRWPARAKLEPRWPVAAGRARHQRAGPPGTVQIAVQTVQAMVRLATWRPEMGSLQAAQQVEMDRAPLQSPKPKSPEGTSPQPTAALACRISCRNFWAAILERESLGLIRLPS